MEYKKSTIVPNVIFDLHLPALSLGELKVLMVIIRQTYGWKSKVTGKRKTRDRIAHSQFVAKTGLSKRVVSTAVSTLAKRGIIAITDAKGNTLDASEKRKGRTYLFYAFRPAQIASPTNAENGTQPVQKGTYDKTNFSKLIRTKERMPQHRMNQMVPVAGLVGNRVENTTSKWARTGRHGAATVGRNP